MGGLVLAVIASGVVLPPTAKGNAPVVRRADWDPWDEGVPDVAFEDRARLIKAIKAASGCGPKGSRLTAADFDAATFNWRAAHIYILPLELEDVLRDHDKAHPNDSLGGKPLDFHGLETNLIFRSWTMHRITHEVLSEHVAGLIGGGRRSTTRTLRKWWSHTSAA